MRFSPDGKMLVTGSWDNVVRIWDLTTGRLSAMWTGHTGPIRGIEFSPDGRIVATSSLDRTIRVWKWPTGEALDILQGHSSTVWAVAFTGDGSQLVSAGGNESDPKEKGELKLWKFPRPGNRY